MDSQEGLREGWPAVVVGSVALGCVYAWLVTKLNGHPRFGATWRRLSWFQVVVGNLLVAGSLGLAMGWGTFVGVVVANVLWGAPMIVWVLWRQTEREAEGYERTESAGVGRDRAEV